MSAPALHAPAVRLIRKEKTRVIISKPTVSSLDLSGCKTVGDLSQVLSQIEPDIVSGDSMLLYTAHDIRGENVPLNGGAYRPQEPLPDSDASALYVSATTGGSYNIALSLSQSILEDRGKLVAHAVTSSQSISQLKKDIQLKYGVEMSMQQLQFKDEVLADDLKLYECRIGRGDPIFVGQKPTINFQFKQMEYKIPSCLNDNLAQVLQKFAKMVDTDIASLRFLFPDVSQSVTQGTGAWLPDRSELFEIGHVAGKVWENGLQNGDRITAYQQHMKRKADKEPDDHGQGSVKRVKVERNEVAAEVVSYED